MLVVCERWAGDGDRLLYWPISTSFTSWLGCSAVSHWGPKALCLPLALNWEPAADRGLVSNSRQLSRAPGYIFVLRPPASAVLPHIYTGASLNWRLGRGSIYIYIYIYILVISSQRPKTMGVGLIAYRIYEEFHINLWECSMHGNCYIFPIQVYIIKLTYSEQIQCN